MSEGETAIKVENLGKKFLINHKVEGDLRSSFVSRFRRLMGYTAGQLNEEFMALHDISFKINKGETVGIIGRNGAGKSTLLKILSRITDPTFGRFEINGRVSSLLEVGTGFHPELTGRENIFLNGTILGMSRTEIRKQFDGIVDFSGVEKFIDTPVKHYSSGMKVRLAFSVAAFLDPEILIIDEVLAVGDADFQKKCLGKMDQVSKNEGRTILFVSHNLAAVEQLCTRGLLLVDGSLEFDSSIEKVVQAYISNNSQTRSLISILDRTDRKGTGEFLVSAIRLCNEHFDSIDIARSGSPLQFEICLNAPVDPLNGSFRVDFALDNEKNWRIGWFSTSVTPNEIGEEFNKIYLSIPKFPFASGTYSLTFYITVNGQVIDYIHQAYYFNVEDGDFFGTGKIIPSRQTFFYIDHFIYTR